MTDTRMPSIPRRVTVDELPVISAVRYGTGTDPVEYIAIVDCGEGTPTHRYATLHLYVRPGEVTAPRRRIRPDLAAGPPQPGRPRRPDPVPHVEVVVLSREPGACDEIAAFVDGEPAPPTGPPVRVTGHVTYLDTDDEQHWWMVAALRGIGHLSLAAQQRITDEITRIAAERGVDLDQLRQEYDQL